MSGTGGGRGNTHTVGSHWLARSCIFRAGIGDCAGSGPGVVGVRSVQQDDIAIDGAAHREIEGRQQCSGGAVIHLADVDQLGADAGGDGIQNAIAAPENLAFIVEGLVVLLEGNGQASKGILKRTVRVDQPAAFRADAEHGAARRVDEWPAGNHDQGIAAAIGCDLGSTGQLHTLGGLQQNIGPCRDGATELHGTDAVQVDGPIYAQDLGSILDGNSPLETQSTGQGSACSSRERDGSLGGHRGVTPNDQAIRTRDSVASIDRIIIGSSDSIELDGTGLARNRCALEQSDAAGITAAGASPFADEGDGAAFALEATSKGFETDGIGCHRTGDQAIDRDRTRLSLHDGAGQSSPTAGRTDLDVTAGCEDPSVLHGDAFAAHTDQAFGWIAWEADLCADQSQGSLLRFQKKTLIDGDGGSDPGAVSFDRERAARGLDDGVQ